MSLGDDDLVMISALEHWSYCPRQCGLIHLEQTFTDNVYTIRGQHAHERAHEDSIEAVGPVRVVRGLPLWSRDLGLVGKADVVEFHGDRPYPIEYKVGRKRRWGHEDIQLAAQAMCLEEMLGLVVPRGAIFYRGSQHRKEVAIDEKLRTLVHATVAAVRTMLCGHELPPALNDARCPSCSLNDACLPDVLAHPRRVQMLYAEAYRVDAEPSTASDASGEVEG